MRLFLLAALALLGAGALVASPAARAQAATANAALAPASDVSIQRNTFGSGSPDGEPGGYENGQMVFNDIYHVPQYLPGYPTAATIWPRVIDVPCTREPNGELQCQGYNWLPKFGRGEYLFFRPVVAVAPGAEAPASEPRPTAAAPDRRRARPDRN